MAASNEDRDAQPEFFKGIGDAHLKHAKEPVREALKFIVSMPLELFKKILDDN